MQISVLVFMANSLFFGIDITFCTHISTLTVTTLPKYKFFSSKTDTVCEATPSNKWVYCMCEGSPYNGVIIHHNHMLICLYLCSCAWLFFFFLVSDAITNWVFLDNEYGQNYYSQQEGKIIFLKDFKKITMKMKLLWNLLQNKLYIIWGI